MESACWGASLSAPCLSPRLPRAVSVRAAGRGAICSGLGERLAAAGSSWRNAECGAFPWSKRPAPGREPSPPQGPACLAPLV